MEAWPYYPTNISSALGEGGDFLSFLVAGAAEQIARAITIIEPRVSIADLAKSAKPLKEKLKRIDPPDRWQRSEVFCKCFREMDVNNNAACEEFDFKFAFRLFSAYRNSSLSREPIASACHVGMTDFACPIFIADNFVGVALAGQFAPSSPLDCKAVIQNALMSSDQDISLDHAMGRSQTLDSYEASIDRSFTSVFGRTIRQLEKIFESKWSGEKRERERLFLEKLEHELLEIGELKSRVQLKSKLEPIIASIVEYLGVSYIAVFTTQQEQISKKTNSDEIHLFVSHGLSSIIYESPPHINWVKSGFADLQAKAASNQGQATFAAPVGLRGHYASRFKESQLTIPFVLSDRHRAIIVFGKFNRIDSNQLQNESKPLKEISSTLANWLLLHLDSVDSESIAIGWIDTAALLAHNARRALNPVDACSTILNEFLSGNPKANRDMLGTMTETLGVVVRTLGTQIQRPMEHYAAAAEKTLDLKQHDFKDLVEACAKLVLESARKRGITIDIQDSVASIGVVEVDRGQYSMAVGHILDNAVKYSHLGKTISISASQESGNVLLHIDDFGLGIERGFEELIYEKKTQGPRSKKAEGEVGDGWGLYHARLIARAHGGNVTHSVTTGLRSQRKFENLEGYRVIFTISVPRENSLNA